MSDFRLYPELAPVLSFACSTVTDAFHLTDNDTDLIHDLQRLGADAVIEAYAPRRAILITMQAQPADTNTALIQRSDTETFADNVATIAATLHRRSNEFASWLVAAPTTVEAQTAAHLLSQAAARSFEHAQVARTLIGTSSSDGFGTASAPARRREGPTDGTPGVIAQRLALGACYDVAVEIMAVAAHRAIHYSDQDPEVTT